MALTEQKILASVNHNVLSNSLEVKWLNKIFRDGVEISSIPHRCSYSPETKDSFIADLGVESSKYITLANW